MMEERNDDGLTLEEFINKTKYSKNRNLKFKNSFGIYDAYKWINDNKWFNIGRKATRHEFYTMIRSMNKSLANELLKGHDIKFPHRMGRLTLTSIDPKPKIVNGKIRHRYPVNWPETYKLWFHDKQAHKEARIVYSIRDRVTYIYYDKGKAVYKNKKYMEFFPNSQLRSRLGHALMNGEVSSIKPPVTYIKP